MRPGDREETPTVSEAVRQAAAICDPERVDDVVTSMTLGFEDDERPASGVEDLAGELLASARAIDPDGDSAGARMTAASAVWLATNPAQAGNADHVLREAARLVFDGEPPEAVRAWLNDRGIDA